MTMWYVNRAAGLVAWALLSASMVLGLLLQSKVLGKKVKPNWLQDLHRGISGLAVVFVGVHVAGAIGDNFIHFGAADVLVPFASGWRPLAIAWGIVSAYLMIAVELSSLLRKHISKSVWRKLHFLSFPLFLTATAHGITAGTEGGSTIGIAIAALVTAGIGGLTALRVVHEIEQAKQPARPRIARPAATPTAPGAPTLSPRSVVASRPASTPRPAPLPPSPPVAPGPARVYQPHTFTVPAPTVEPVRRAVPAASRREGRPF